MQGSVLLSSAYLGSVSYYQTVASADQVRIEQYDHYHKQTYRNRCRILTSNGVMDLSVPVINTGAKMCVKDLRIAYVENWQQVHWRAIASAYNSSPFFEYYRDDFEPFYTRKTEFLIDLNMELMRVVMELIGLKTEVSLTDDYLTETSPLDLREAFSPKTESTLPLRPYYQVFDQKFGFVRDMGVLDLLFNMGPESILYLK
ncbi:MAG: WbqC family protein [Paludibacteraceae bacterium]|nr:WbqC family protein [Paludibacteraceae bacterium]